ncbi:MAG: DNA polymerase/3'-5' exonuclease PolX [Sphingobacteriia bacterium]|nr:DNA polymerase/3'-5' exonuclease PolX [Sphingobacteriia bacterium]
MEIDNSSLADYLKLTAQLLEIRGENSFKVNAYSQAAFKIDKYPESISQLIHQGRLGAVDGIGTSIKAALEEIVKNNSFTLLTELLDQTPPGILELLKIKGLGPKKVAVVWHQLGITTPGELLYACIENRLLELKGFGQKTQENIKKAIEFLQASNGLAHFASVAQEISGWLPELEKLTEGRVWLSGEMRRESPIIREVLILLDSGTPQLLMDALVSSPRLTAVQQTDQGIKASLKISEIPVILKIISKDIINELIISSADPKHLEEVGIPLNEPLSTEEEWYTKAGLPCIPPTQREGKGEVARARKVGILPDIRPSDLKGVLHLHTRWSDGLNTLEEMAIAAQKLGYQYLGVTDHSKSAVYANGLSEGRVEAQQVEIQSLNKKLFPFKIFSGIEADILGDGSLDYSPEILSTFDFVIASIHSHLNMTEEKAMLRLLNAIENPYTTILGHLTGRLLLARAGYPVNHKLIIDACANNNVVIELNANPWRLDMDWEWISYAVEKGVKISINPDAHSIAGYQDIHWGISAANKSGVGSIPIFNSLSTAEIENWFTVKKNNAKK